MTDQRGETGLPVEARRAVQAHQQALDAAAPGLLTGLYLVGSLGYGVGEFHPHISDIDFVAVLAERPEGAALEAVREAVLEVVRRHPEPSYDGFHLTAEDLARSPAECPGVPSIHEGEFRAEGSDGVGLVPWHELAEHRVPVRGPALGPGEVWTDRDALRAYSHANLTEYWADRLEELAGARERVLAGPPERGAWITQWFVTGIPRLCHLLATDRLTSKDGAGRYALEAFDARWHPVVREALRIRAGDAPDPASRYAGDPGRRFDDTVAFSRVALAAGLELKP